MNAWFLLWAYAKPASWGIALGWKRIAFRSCEGKSPAKLATPLPAPLPYPNQDNMRLRPNLVDLLHLGGLVSSTIDLLERGKVVIIPETLIVVVDAKSKLDHAMNAACKLRWLVEIESRRQEGGVEEKPDQILDGLVRFVGRSLLLQFGHDGVLRVHLHRLLRHHVGGHAAVAQSLRLHDTLHVGRPTILRRCQHTRRICQARTDQDLLNFVTKHLLHQLGQWLKLSLQFFYLLLLVLIVNFEALLGCRLQLLTIKLLQLLHCVLVNGVNHVQNLQTLLPQRFEEGRRRNCSNALTGDVVDVVLPFLHPIDILLEADLFVARLGTMVAHQLGDLRAICGVLVHAQLEALAELLVELLVP